MKRNYTTSDNGRNVGSEKIKKSLWLTSMLFMLMMFGQNLMAQVSYTTAFPNASSWTTAGGWAADSGFNGTIGCSAVGSMRLNLYSGATTGQINSPLIGTANVSLVTFTYNYKVLNYNATSAAPTGFGTFTVQYASSAAGPWTTAQTIGVGGTAHVSSTACAAKSATFTPPAGNLFVRFNTSWTTGDWQLYVDDISITQPGGTPSYCSTTYTNGCNAGSDAILNVTCGTLNNSSGCAASPYYTFYSAATVPDLARSTSVNVVVSMGNDGTQAAGAWIDFNQNFTFESSEGVVSALLGANGVATLTFNVPAAAVLGITRLRVRGGNDVALTTAQACGVSSNTWGETEDYRVNIVATAAACSTPPPSLAVSAVTSNSANVSWGTPSPAPTVGYQYAVTTSATAPASGTATGGNSASVGSLTANTTYYLHVRAACTGPIFSSWSTLAFTTSCSPVTTLPSTQGFDGSAQCWTVTPISGTGNWALYTAITTEVPGPHSGSQFVGINWNSSVSTNSLLISPPYNISASGNAQTRVRVWIYRGANGLTTNRVTVRVNTSAAAGGTTLIDIPRNMAQAPTVATAGWYEYIANVPVSFNGATFYITSQGTVGSGFSDYSLGLDDFRLEFSPPTVVGFGPMNICASHPDALRTITINGDGFIGVTAVSVNGTPVQSFVINNANQISAVVSSAATSGTISVTNPGGTGTSAGTLAIYQNYDFYADADGDTFGESTPTSLCSINSTTPPPGYVLNNTDCNDAQLNYTDADGDGFGSDTLIPCGGVTNTDDCNDAQLNYSDADGDLFGSDTLVACGGVTNTDDCDDGQLNYTDVDGDGFGSDTLIACGGVTNTDDCDDTQTTYADADGDGFGFGPAIACGAVTNNSDCDDTQTTYADGDGDGFGFGPAIPCGVVTNNSDCDDTQATFADADGDGFGVNPLVPCGPVTNNFDCDDTSATYADADGDGFGSGPAIACGAVTNNSDCNDSSATYADVDGDGFGSGPMIACGAVTNDDDCNDGSATYADADGDGFGFGPMIACGAVTNNTDCNDAQLQYVDGDGDGFGSSTLTDCGVANSTDCNDGDMAVNSLHSFYTDADGDTYGTGALINNVCAANATTPPAGYSTNNTDCDDNIAAVNPGASEVLYDGVDNNCNNQLDEGFQIKTKLLPESCGTTLASISSLIGITTVSSAITMYRIRVTNGAQVQIIERNVPHFTLTNLPSYQYATTYTVEIMLQRNGIWLGYYGDPCLVSSPAVLAENGATQVSPSQCGITLPRVNTLIATTSLAGVTGYRFKVTNITAGAAGPNIIQTIDRQNHWFSLPMLTQYNYGSTYRVEVAVKTNGAYSGFGAPCEISSPASPTLINCGGVVASQGTLVAATSMQGATQYRFQIIRLSDNASTTIDRNTNSFSFAMVPGYTPAAQYGVRVAVMTVGTWSPFGDICEITSPGTAARFTPEVATSVSDSFKAVAYPNPFVVTFSIDVTTSIATDVEISVYDMTGRLIEERKTSASDIKTLQVGGRLPSGVYNVIVTQGNNVETLRVIKR